MVDAIVEISDDRSIVGKFKFDTLPRKGDEITVPWADDAYGVRIFDVEEVGHVAEGVSTEEFGIGPSTVLKVREII